EPNNIFIRFYYQSKVEISLDRESFRDSLNERKRGISILTAKKLLVTEKLFSMCHTFGEKLVYSGTDTRTVYSGSFDDKKLEELINDEKAEKITEVWNSIDNAKFCLKPNVNFLIDLLYVNNPLDKKWDSLTNTQASIGELVIIQRSNGKLRFGKI